MKDVCEESKASEILLAVENERAKLEDRRKAVEAAALVHREAKKAYESQLDSLLSAVDERKNCPLFYQEPSDATRQGDVAPIGLTCLINAYFDAVSTSDINVLPVAKYNGQYHIFGATASRIANEMGWQPQLIKDGPTDEVIAVSFDDVELQAMRNAGHHVVILDPMLIDGEWALTEPVNAPDSPATEAADGAAVAVESTTAEPSLRKWRDVPVRDLDLPTKIITKLIDAEYGTIGDLRDHEAKFPLTSISGIGDKSAETISDALASWFESHPGPYEE